MNGHLEYPSLCPSTILDQLNECWKYDPQDRPSFHILVDCFNETKTELGKLIPDIQNSRLEELHQTADDQVDKITDMESIEEQDKSSLCHKHKKHKSCAIFTLIFLVMCSAGGVYAFRNFIWIPDPPTTTTSTSTGKMDYLITTS